MKCPYCGSKDTVHYGEETDENGIYIKKWGCYVCHRFFDERNIPNCGNKTFHYGDNFPNFKQEREQYKDLGLIPKRTNDNMADLWIDLWELLKDKTKETK